MPVVINEWVAETAPEADKAVAEPAKADEPGAPPNPRAIETIMRRVHDRHARIRE
jgi:hypothetical protein